MDNKQVNADHDEVPPVRMTIPEVYRLMDGLPIGNWVAISTSQRKVLAYGKDSDEVYAQARLLGEKVPFIGKVPDPDAQPFVSRL